MSGKLPLIYMCNFHVLNHLLLIYMCKLHWNLNRLEEAIERCKMFRKLGADMTFLEAPQSEEEMERYCREVV